MKYHGMEVRELFNQQFSYLSDEMRNQLYPNLIFEKQKKHSIFLQAGEHPKKFAFCLSGMYRFYYIDYEGKEITKHFAKEGNLLIAYNSLIHERESRIYIEALEDSCIGVMDYTQFVTLKSQHECIRQAEFELLQIS